MQIVVVVVVGIGYRFVAFCVCDMLRVNWMLPLIFECVFVVVCFA